MELIITTEDQLNSIVTSAMNLEVRRLLAETPTKTPTKEPVFITVPEAAILTRRKPSTIYKLVQKEKIPFYKDGDHKKANVLFKPKELIEWIEKTRNKTHQELLEEADNDLIENN